MTETLSWRKATEQDTEALSLLVNSAYRGDVSRAGWTTEADLLDGQRTDPQSLQELVSDPASVLLLLEDAGALIGCVNLRKKPGCAYLGMLTVKPTLQAAGIGKKLLAIAEGFVSREWNLPRIEMTVIIQRESLIAWYERRGYRRTGKRERFPYGDARFGLPKRDDLEFEVLEKTL
jgi:ribosomal protein S18 acetylase RimI-like enzyme